MRPTFLSMEPAMTTLGLNARSLFLPACLVALAALLFATPAPAQKPPVHTNTDNHMTNLKGYGLQQYMNSHFGAAAPARPSSPKSYAAPQRSTVQVSPLPYSHAVPHGVAVQPYATVGPAPVAARLNAVVPRPAVPAPPAEIQPVAFVIAHLPPGADLWIEDTQMFSDVQKAEVTMVTPALEKGKWYTYTATVRWVEDGKWVGQMHTFDVRVGDIHHLEVTPSTAPSVQKEIAASLAKLDKADRAAAEKQKFCAVQDTIHLGSMGAPVKVAVKGTDVFLCCPACKVGAEKNPNQTLKTAEQNKDKK